MKICKYVIVIAFCTQFVFSADFIRNLPDQKLVGQLTPESCRNMDAIIILKEQSYFIHESEIEYQGVTLSGPAITTTQVLIAKLFNEKAVDRYGTFEFSYSEPFGDEITNNFEARVRVLKSDGKVHIVSKENIKIIVSAEMSDGTPLQRKAIIKTPDLQPGDVIQIEYSLMEKFSWTSSEIFYYNDRDFILFSNFYITLPSDVEAKYYSVPQEKIGQPIIKQVSENFGAGKTYFWNLRNLNGIPDEPFSLSFEDQSMLTAFVIDKWDINDESLGDWDILAEDYYNDHFKPRKWQLIDHNRLGIPVVTQNTKMNWDIIDSLYSALRKSITLNSYNSLYPLRDNIDKVIKSGKGDASDLCYIMNHILDDWNVTTNAIWIRDRREGIFEKTIPSTDWFDRIGLLVTIGKEERVYDFDTSIPTKYHLPWYLKDIEIAIVNKNWCQFKNIENKERTIDNVLIETHNININSTEKIIDQIELYHKGAFADKYRSENYGETDLVQKEKVKSSFSPVILSQVDLVTFNECWDSSDVVIHISGPSSNQMEQVDKFQVIKLNNKIVKNFRDNLFSISRSSTINLWFPFQFRLVWKITSPDGYKFKNDIPIKIINGPVGCKSKIYSDVTGNQMILTAEVEFPNKLMPVSLYRQMMQFLDDVTSSLNVDIILESK
ncbi:MAG: DUF3857 domain-containing protein [Candidatus Marinimicrobia bacterium]|nr:DUF3857 domain-containing protein [Candidatus Neomarinimicrobiota bacterium]